MSVTIYKQSPRQQTLSNGVVLHGSLALPNRVIMIKAIAVDSLVTTGDGKTSVVIPADLDGLTIIGVGAHVYTVSSSGAVTVQIHKTNSAADLLSTAITIDQSEKDSSTAATAAVINSSHATVATGDEFRIDVDGAGTGTKGLDVWLEFE